MSRRVLLHVSRRERSSFIRIASRIASGLHPDCVMAGLPDRCLVLSHTHSEASRMRALRPDCIRIAYLPSITHHPVFHLLSTSLLRHATHLRRLSDTRIASSGDQTPLQIQSVVRSRSGLPRGRSPPVGPSHCGSPGVSISLPSQLVFSWDSPVLQGRV